MSTPPEQTPSTPPAPPSAGPSATSGSTDDRGVAVLIHLSGIIFCFIVPLIVWLANKDNDAKGYLASESREALNFQITVLICYIISWILMAVYVGFFLIWLVWLANLVFCIVAALAVGNSGTYRYPYCLRLLQ